MDELSEEQAQKRRPEHECMPFGRRGEEEKLQKIPDRQSLGSRRTKEKVKNTKTGQFPKGKRVSNALEVLSKLKQKNKFSERKRNHSGI